MEIGYIEVLFHPFYCNFCRAARKIVHDIEVR